MREEKKYWIVSPGGRLRAVRVNSRTRLVAYGLLLTAIAGVAGFLSGVAFMVY